MPPRSARICPTSAPMAPGAWGTTSTTCSTRSRASSGSPTTGPSPSSASATSARRSPTTAASARAASASWRSSTPIPRRSGHLVGDLAVDALSDLPVLARERSVAIGIIATPAHAAQEVTDRLVEAGVTSILNFAPTVVAAPAGRLAAQGRPRDRAPDPVVLPTAPSGRRAHRRERCSRPRAMNGRAAITGYPVNLVVQGRRCVVVGAGRIAARKIAALLDAGRRRARRRARCDGGSAGLGRRRDPPARRPQVRAGRPRRSMARDHRHRRSRRRPLPSSPRPRIATSG